MDTEQTVKEMFAGVDCISNPHLYPWAFPWDFPVPSLRRWRIFPCPLILNSWLALKISFSRNDASREMKNTYWLDLPLAPVLQLWGDSLTHPRGRRETCRAELPLKQLQLSPTHYRGPSWLKNTWADPAKMNWTMCQLWSIIINGHYLKPVF